MPYTDSPAPVDKKNRTTGVPRTHTVQTDGEVFNLNDIFEKALECISRIDTQGHFLGTNQRFLDAYGYAPEELTTLTWRDLTHEDDWSEAERAIADMHRTGRGEYEGRGIRKNGSMFWKHCVKFRSSGNTDVVTDHYCFMRDITEQKLKEQRRLEEINQDLNKTQKLLSGIINSLPGAVYQYRLGRNGQQDFPYMSAGAARLFGLSAAEIMQESSKAWSIVHAADIEGLTRSIAVSAHELSPWHYEFRVHEPDGGIRWLRGYSIPEPPDAEGNIVWNGLFIDVTDDKQTAERLADKERDLRTIIDTEPECVKLVAEDGTILDMNPAGLAMLEAESLEQVRGMHVSKLVNLPYQNTFMELHHKVLNGYTGKLEFEITGLKGKQRWLQTHSSPLRDRDGRIIAHLSVTHDISERKRIELALREGQAHMRLLSDSVPVIISYIDQDLKYQYVNSNFENTFGYSRNDVLGKPINKVADPREYQKIKPHLKAALTGKVVKYEHFMQRDDKKHIYEITLTPHIDSHGTITGVYMVSNDVTSRVQNTRALKMQSHCNAIIAQANTENQLLHDICRIIVKEGEYCFAWIGYKQRDEHRTVSPVTWSGLESGYLDKKITWADDSHGQGPVGKAIRGGQTIIVHDIATEPGFDLWRDDALERGYRTIMVMPIQTDSDIIGTLAIYSTGKNSFDKEEAKLLKHLGDNLSHGIRALRARIQREKATRALRQSEERFRNIFEHSPVGMMLLDPAFRIAHFNPAFSDMIGYREAELFQHGLEHIMSPEILEAQFIQLRQLNNEHPNHAEEQTYIHQNGEIIHVTQNTTLITDSKGRPEYYLLQMENITETRRLSERLSFQERHDALTGLPNRRELERRLALLLNNCRVEKSEHALCHIDLDQFKIINDACGHLAGDELLRQIAGLLQARIRKSDILARLGGDKFALLMEYCSISQAERVAEALCNEIYELRFNWEDRRYTPSASIGVVTINENSGELSNILSMAEAACYAAKDAGRNRVHIYRLHDENLEARRGEMQWAVRIHEALDEKQLRLCIQSIRPARPRTDLGHHYEFLLRMQDKSGKMVMPGAFMPAAERYNLSIELDKWVLQHALGWMAENPRRLRRIGLCSINLSGHSLGDDAFLQLVLSHLQTGIVPAHKICFEITETQAVQNLGRATNFIRAIKAKGCRFALDDFGSGFSSFKYLRTLPVDYLKIDGSFVRDLATDKTSYAMVRSINQIGKLMGKQTIAEFVENRIILEKLQTIGVDFVQGYAIGKPRMINLSGQD